MTTETEIKVDAGVNLSVSDAVGMLEAAFSCAGAANLGRPTLEAVRVLVRDGRVRMAAADGFRLAEVVSESEQTAEIDILIPRESVQAALKMLTGHKKNAGATVEITAGRVAVIDPDANLIASLAFTPTEGSFPNYEQLIPPVRDVDYSRFAMNGKFLAEVGKIVGKYGASGIVRVQPGADAKSPIRFDFTGTDDWYATFVIMPMFVDWK